MVFWYVGALALSVSGAVALTILLPLPWWNAIILAITLSAVRIAITDRQPHQKIMDIGNGSLIALAVWRLLF